MTNIAHVRGLAKKAERLLTKDFFKFDRVYRAVNEAGQVVNQNLLLPILPFSQRNAIDTEERVGNAAGEIILGGKYRDRESLSVKLNDGTATELEGMKYRMQGHKFLVSGATSDMAYEAFGGFDLDDKVISDLAFLRDTNGNKRLASFVWRQPTGPQEFAIMFPHLDEDTLIRMLGSHNQFGERFQMLAGAVSDSISEERFHRIPSAKIGITATELNMLNEEEKIVKYVSLLSRNKSAAKQYIQGMDANSPQFFEKVEKAIFRILDVGSRDASGSTIGLQFSESSRNISIENILKHFSNSREIIDNDYRFINLPQIHDDIVKIASAGRFGTPRQLTPEIAEKLAEVDPKFGMQYRQSGFIKMFETKMSLNVDASDPVLQTIRGMLDSDESIRASLGDEFRGKTYNEIFETTRAALRNPSLSNENDVAYRIAGKLLQSNSINDEMKFQIEEAFNRSFNRQQFAAFGADDGLGIYVNKLGFATSLDMQREDAVQDIITRLQSSGVDNVDFMKERLASLRMNSIPVYTPEAAIDAAIAGGGGRFKVSGSVQDLYYAAQIFTSDSEGVLDEFTRGRAINQALSRMAVLRTDIGSSYPEEEFFDNLRKAYNLLDYDTDALIGKMRGFYRGLNNEKFTEGLQEVINDLLGVSREKFSAGLTDAGKAFESAAFSFMDVGAGSVGSAAVAGSAKDIRRNTFLSNYVRCRKVKKSGI